MLQRRRLLWGLVILLTFSTAMAALGAKRTAHAYSTDGRWQNSFAVNYAISASLGGDLGLPNAAVKSAIDGAAFNWNISSSFKFYNMAGGYGINSALLNSNTYAVASVDIDQNTRQVRSQFMSFNRSSFFTWNTAGDMTVVTSNGAPVHRNADVQKIGSSEFGHWLEIGHPSYMFPTPPNTNTGDYYYSLTSLPRTINLCKPAHLALKYSANVRGSVHGSGPC